MNEVVIKEATSNKEILDAKQEYVKACFSSYQFHKHMEQYIQSELTQIAIELQEGRISGGIKTIHNGPMISMSPWQNELFARECTLVNEQNSHLTELERVDAWLEDMDENHRGILTRCLINKRRIEETATLFFMSNGNVSKIINREVIRIAKKIA